MRRFLQLCLLWAFALGVAHATTVNLGPVPLQQFNQGGVPCAGCKLFTYAAGTTTKLSSYTDSTGVTANSNPIILDSNGQAAVWLTAGSAYKLVLSPPTDTDPPTSPYWTENDITGIGDTSSLSGSTGATQVGYIGSLSGMSQTTVAAALQRVVSIQDYGATCNGTTNDNAAWTAAIASIGSAHVTLLVNCPSKISTSYTLGANTTLWFTNQGQVIGTTGSEVLTTGNGITSDLHQIFVNLSAVAPATLTGTSVYPEWFGAVRNGSTSDLSAINAALDYFAASGGGNVVLSAGNYAIGGAISHFHNRTALVGAGPNVTQLTETNNASDGIDLIGLAATPIASPSLSGFNINASNIGTGGINMQYTALARVSDIQVNGFIEGVNLVDATNSFFTRVGVSYNGSTNGFIGFNINGTGTNVGGNESTVFRDCYVQGFSGTTGKIAYRAYGAYVSDLYFDNDASAEMDYGYELDYSVAMANGYADVTIVNPVVDGFTQQGILINVSPTGQKTSIIGGWINPASTGAETDDIYVTGSGGQVSISGGTQLQGDNNFANSVGLRVINSNNVQEHEAQFGNCNHGVEETGSGYNVYGGSFWNASADTAAVNVSMTGSSRSMVIGATFQGYATVGVSADSTSTGVGVVGSTFNASTIGTRISNSSSGPIGGSNGSTGLNSGT
jgi:hypothetical protein